jgi:alpha-beta hydrolase superfamily lysophospholipase
VLCCAALAAPATATAGKKAAAARGGPFAPGAIWRAPTARQSIEVIEQRIRAGVHDPRIRSVLQHGRGPHVVLMLHAHLSNPREFQLQIDALGRAGYTVYAPIGPGIGRLGRDRKGRVVGDKSEFPSAEHRHQDLAFAESVFQQALQLRGAGGRLFVVGTSRGGGQAAYIAQQRPAEVERIALISPFFRLEPTRYNVLHTIVRSLDRALPGALFGRLLDRVPFPSPRDLDRMARFFVDPPRDPLAGEEWRLSLGHYFALTTFGETLRASVRPSTVKTQIFTTVNENVNSRQAMAEFFRAIGGTRGGHAWKEYGRRHPRARHVLNDPRRSDPLVAQDITDKLVEFFGKTGRTWLGAHSPPNERNLAAR